MTKGGAPRIVIEPVRVASYVCACCGYGVATARLPERCPMCTGRRWVPLAPTRSSLARL